MNKNFIVTIIIISLLILAGGVFLRGKDREGDGAVVQVKEIEVFLSPQCGCCAAYVSYLQKQGFEVKREISSNTELTRIKSENQVPENLYSCHTSVIDGYVVEGHIPVETILNLLEERPDIRGIALPGMPSGAPGMTGPKTGGLDIRTITSEGKEGGAFVEL